MSDAELLALSNFCLGNQIQMKRENDARISNGQAVCWQEGVDPEGSDKLLKELTKRGVL